MNTAVPGIVAGGIFFLIWIVLMGGIIVGWIIFLIAVWRGMKAHESIAESIQRLANK